MRSKNIDFADRIDFRHYQRLSELEELWFCLNISSVARYRYRTKKNFIVQTVLRAYM